MSGWSERDVATVIFTVGIMLAIWGALGIGVWPVARAQVVRQAAMAQGRPTRAGNAAAAPTRGAQNAARRMERLEHARRMVGLRGIMSVAILVAGVLLTWLGAQRRSRAIAAEVAAARAAGPTRAGGS